MLPPETKQGLETNENFILFTLDPGVNSTPRDAPTNDVVFHGYTIKQRLQIDDKKDRDELLQELYNGIAERNHPRAICFEPEFGIRSSTGDGHVDLVICFECGGIDVYAKHGRDVVTTKSPLEAFNRMADKLSKAVRAN